jgi:BASS family bile acid:Na+ symporter
VEKVRGQVVNWGFALIIFVAVGMNRQVFFGDFVLLLLISTVLLSSLFGMGSLYQFWARRRGEPGDLMLSRTLLITIKSSGFAAVTAFSLFGDRAAIPSAVMAVAVLMYLLFLSFRS